MRSLTRCLIIFANHGRIEGDTTSTAGLPSFSILLLCSPSELKDSQLKKVQLLGLGFQRFVEERCVTFALILDLKL